MPSPCSVSIPAECNVILGEIQSLQTEIHRLQAELRSRPPQEKAQIVVEIRELNAQKAEREAAYAACANNPRPLAMRFTGTMFATFSDPRLGSQAAPGVDFTAHFTPQRDALTVYSMSDILSSPFTMVDVFGGVYTIVTTVQLQSPVVGRVRPGCNLTLPDTLRRFVSAVDAPSPTPNFSEIDNLTVTLTTSGPGGSAIDADGRATLVGTGTFVGDGIAGVKETSILDGQTCTVSWTGAFTDV
jgi:hypothetical protein